MLEVRSRIPMHTRVDANRKRKCRDQAIPTYVKHIFKKKDKFPKYITQHNNKYIVVLIDFPFSYADLTTKIVLATLARIIRASTLHPTPIALSYHNLTFSCENRI